MYLWDSELKSFALRVSLAQSVRRQNILDI
jgi:hypothetical protein